METTGLAKTAESSKPIEPIEHDASPLSTMTSGEVAYMGVPVDLYSFFGLDLGKATEKERERMGYIYRRLDGDTPGNKMMKLREIEWKLGRSGFDSMLDKINRYLRMQEEVAELQLRSRAMER